MIYLASPYSHDDPQVVEHRFKEVCRVAALLMNRGIHLFCPIAHTHLIAVAGDLPRGWEFWNEFDQWFVSNCDELWVVTLEGWDKSKGVNAEVVMALAMGKPIKYIDSNGDVYAGVEQTK